MASSNIGVPKFRRGWLLAALTIIAIGGLLLFQVRRSAAAASGPPKILTIAGIATPFGGKQVFNGVTGVVIEQGWLKRELAKRGVELAFTPIPTAVGGPLINEGFSGKRIDFAAYGDFPAVIAVAGGVPLKIVTPVGRGQNSYLVVRNGLAAQDIKDLKGKRIALHRGRPWELPFSKLLDANGLKLSDFTIVNINPSATPAALASGDIDAAFLLSDGLLLARKGVGHIIWSTKQAPADWKMRAELFGRGDFVDTHPELTQLVVDAYIRAAAWSADPAHETQVLRDSSRGYLPESVLREDYAEPGVSWRDRFSPLYDTALRDHYRSVTNYTFERGLVPAKVDAEPLFDDRFVTRALRDLKLEGFWRESGAPKAASVPAAAQAGKS